MMREAKITFVTVLAMGISTTVVCAAANPFADVPRDHWAYDAVSQLAEDGIIEGYGDSTFKGNRNITRYEMAQMVARAMAKTDVSGRDKAALDKLAAEFSEELNNLGVRVANLERNADKVSWHGEARYTYTSKKVEGNDKVNRGELRLRLEPKAEINEHWTANARLDADTYVELDGPRNNSDQVKLKRIYAQGDYKNLQLKVGKISAQTFYDNMMMFADEFSGAEVTFGNKLKTRVRAGRMNLAAFGAYATASGVGAGQNDAVADLQSIAFNYKVKGFEGTAALYHFKAGAFKDNGTTAVRNYRYSRSGDEEHALIWELAGSYRFDKNWRILGAYAQNTKADYYNKAAIAQLEYKGSAPQDVGSWGAYLAYRHLGGNVALDTLPDGCGLNEKGWEVGTKATLAKNIQAQVIYFFGGKRLVNDRDVSKLFGRLEYWF